MNLILFLILSFIVSREVEFNLEIYNEYLTAESVSVFISIPPDIHHQKIKKITFNPEPDRIISEPWGQKLAYFFIEKLRPYEKREFIMKVYVEFSSESDYRVSNSLVDFSEYLKDDPYLRMNSHVLRKLSEDLLRRSKNEEEYIKNVLDTISDLLVYNIDGKWENAERVLFQRHGSCSEYSFLFSSLMRLAGIPTRFVGGTVERRGGIDRTFHRWVEVYIKGKGWIPIDPQFYDTPKSKGRFFPDFENLYLITTIEPHTMSYLGSWYNYNIRAKNGIIKVRAFYKWKK